MKAQVIAARKRAIFKQQDIKPDKPTISYCNTVTEAFPWARPPSYLIRDNVSAYGHVFTGKVKAMGIRDRPISSSSPWQNGIAERLIGTLRGECLDHIVIFDERHLRCVLCAYAAYYNQPRPHRSLQKDAPLRRAIQRIGEVAAMPILVDYLTIRSDMIFGKDT